MSESIKSVNRGSFYGDFTFDYDNVKSNCPSLESITEMYYKVKTLYNTENDSLFREACFHMLRSILRFVKELSYEGVNILDANTFYQMEAQEIWDIGLGKTKVNHSVSW